MNRAVAFAWIGVGSVLGLSAFGLAPAIAAGSDPPPTDPGIALAALPGFAEDDHRAALQTFRASCAAREPARSAIAVSRWLPTVCRAAKALAPDPDEPTARAFLETHFEALRIPGDAFFTGYYEPVVDGSLTPTPEYATPLFPRPPDLVTIDPGERRPGLDQMLTAARRQSDGRLGPPPDRAAINAGALGQLRPLLYVREPVDAFFIQVQGSARVRLPDGSLRRLVFAGRNGYPYTSIGKVLVQTLGIPPKDMGMAQLAAWIRANGQGRDEAGTRLMQRNRSYIFFRFDDALPSRAGPIGGEGVSLTALRSIAIDHTRWPYGLPFYIDAVLPWSGDMPTPMRRLMIAQDTGSAIIGKARADIFFGSGAEAARYAGALRHGGALYVLRPRAP